MTQARIGPGRFGRRAVMAAGLAVLVPRRLRAASPPAGGIAGLICTRAGLAGVTLQGEAGAALDPAARWHLGSNTKAMTALLWAHLVDAGRCRWDTPVPALFPTLSADPAWSDRRVEDLLCHAAGLTDRTVTGAWLRERHADRAPAPVQRRRLVAQLLAAPPGGARGGFAYGNLNYVLVGAAIEAVLQRSWEDAVRAELFTPLGMTEAGFGAPHIGPWGREGVAARPVDPAGIADNPAVLWPAGGVHASSAAYAAFLGVYLGARTRLVRSATLGRLLTPTVAANRYAGGWGLAGPADVPAERLAHDGSNTLWYATALIDRGLGRGYAAMTNRGGDAGAAATRQLLSALRRGGAIAVG